MLEFSFKIAVRVLKFGNIYASLRIHNFVTALSGIPHQAIISRLYTSSFSISISRRSFISGKMFHPTPELLN
jgi:hypothetical protein